MTNDEALADSVRLFRSHGERPRYHHRVVGTTSRLDGLQAAVLRAKLRRLDGWNDERRWAAAELRDALAGSAVEQPLLPCSGGDHVYHLFVVRCDVRDRLREHLAAQGIASAVHYPVPIHRTEAYRSCAARRAACPSRRRRPNGSFRFRCSRDDREEVAAISAAVRSFA